MSEILVQSDQPAPSSATSDASTTVSQSNLSIFNHIRPRILSDVVQQTTRDLSASSLEVLLTTALYSERHRLKVTRPSVFTYSRYKSDKAMWARVQSSLLKSGAVSDRKQILNHVLSHYAEEIGGHFDQSIYRFATGLVPMGFNWLLNAATVDNFLPWNMTESLDSTVKVTGEVAALQKLAQKGTILLVPTHQSNIDSILIGWLIYKMNLPPFAYGAGLNLFSNPALSFFMSRLGAYTVDRQKTNVLYKQTLKNYSTRILREGIHSIFFPGGGRAKSGAIESKLKLGLLGTGLEAQIANYSQGRKNPNVYVVPMVMSYHFVLEASSLIEDYLAEAGKHQFLVSQDESNEFTKVLSFFWKLFQAQSGITVRIGKPLDVFGNFVDEEGRSIGPNGSTIDPVCWLTTRGELGPEPQRDMEYTRELGLRVSDRFRNENTVFTSHLVAFSFFETLRKHYPDLGLYRFLRMSLEQRSLPYEEFLKSAEIYHGKIRAAADRGQLYVADELMTTDTKAWVEDGIRNLGLMHDASVLKVRDGAIFTEDMMLLYYYRNRLAGYGLSLLGDPDQRMPGQNDEKGFLA